MSIDKERLYFAGVQPTSLIDFPDRIAAVLFVSGCNFRCPYCHNPAAVKDNGTVSIEAVMNLLTARAGKIDGVVVSGGEPTIRPGLPDLLRAIRDLDLDVKLDTNGSDPAMLERVIGAGLVDYVAMDVKSDPKRYPITLWSSAGRFGAIAESMLLLRESGVPHEFRTTCVEPFVTSASFRSILDHAGDSLLYLQEAKLSGNVLDPGFFEFGNGSALLDSEIWALYEMGGENCRIRGWEGHRFGEVPINGISGKGPN